MLWLILAFLACKGNGDADDSGLCADPPVVTWENFGAGFIVERCQPCHASTSPNRNGAPEDVTFDTHEEVIDLIDRILELATGDDPAMPPQGGVTEDDLILLETWLTCWE